MLLLRRIFSRIKTVLLCSYRSCFPRCIGGWKTGFNKNLQGYSLTALAPHPDNDYGAVSRPFFILNGFMLLSGFVDDSRIYNL
jgi:hypothetical protein